MTFPPVPVDDNPDMVLLAIVSVATVPLPVCEIPTICPLPVILEMVFEEIVEVPPNAD